MSVGEDRALEQIERLYRTRLPEFLRVATAIGGGGETARDAVHDAFVTAIRRRGQYRGEGCIEAWLWRIVVTTALKVRRASKEPAARSQLPEQCSDDRRREEIRNVRAAIARLPERQRLILFLRYYADLDYRTIADVLRVRPGTVAASLNAAHRTLRSCIEEVLVHD